MDSNVTMKRSIKGMQIPKCAIEEIEKNMTVKDAIKILKNVSINTEAK